ncbi:hypothetical protein DSLASN_06120 [Desulfoluna limicola]|uniref:Uncharacterized protein n=1 Tax=Desulfoluna limicola TaxID=2810562 RepID=A0ABM7PCN0_9BACT|nr:hypothetical protein [Desulfoluna limicola]BCS94980.1 hypothetical protein DSLASN_06120 [Desulfoluna limicola]
MSHLESVLPLRFASRSSSQIAAAFPSFNIPEKELTMGMKPTFGLYEEKKGQGLKSESVLGSSFKESLRPHLIKKTLVLSPPHI